MPRRDCEKPSIGDPKVRVIYISGASRSGSTVLAALLGSQAESVSVGELVQLHRAGWLHDEYCACATRCSACPFWTQVLAQWQALCGDVDVSRYLKLQSRFERLRSWPRLILGARLDSAAYREYIRQTTGLLRSICAVSGKRVVVDSSKRPMRALALSRLPDVDLHVLHLVRDVRATAWSQAKGYRKDPRSGLQTEKPPQPVWRSTRDWLLAHALAEWLGKSATDRFQRLRYEDLVDRPEQALMGVQSFLEQDLQDIIARVLAGAEFPVGHQIAGNRVRMQGNVRLRADTDWLEAMPAAQRDACWRMAGWFARRYGYSRNLPDRSDLVPRLPQAPDPQLPAGMFPPPHALSRSEGRTTCSSG